MMETKVLTTSRRIHTYMRKIEFIFFITNMAPNHHKTCWLNASDARKAELLDEASAIPMDDISAAIKWLRELSEDERVAAINAYSHTGYYSSAVELCKDPFTFFNSPMNTYANMILARDGVQYDPEELMHLIEHYRKYAFFEKLNIIYVLLKLHIHTQIYIHVCAYICCRAAIAY